MAVLLNVVLWIIAIVLIVYEAGLISAYSTDTAQTDAGGHRTHYVAAVVEYQALGDPNKEDPQKVIGRNWVRYHRFMHQARDQGVDIIVFPECGLTTMNLPASRTALRPILTPIPRPGANPCDDVSAPQVLRNASCAARQTSMYTVINLAEVEECAGASDCPDDGAFFYNTNVAFDRNGSIVARYRKTNLFVEPGFNAPARPDPAVFDTDWGGRVGLLTCQDLLFSEPAHSLVDQWRISDLAYPAAWFNELPFLVATSVQAGWAAYWRVAVLAAGYHRPSAGNAGTGVFEAGGRTLVAGTPTDEELGAGMLLIAPVPIRVPPTPLPLPPPPTPAPRRVLASPIHIRTSRAGDLSLYQDYLRPYHAVELDPAEEYKIRVCHSGDQSVGAEAFCCDIDAELRVDPAALGTYRYMAGVFSGVRNFGGVTTAGVKVCGIMACIGEPNQGSEFCGLWNSSRSAREVTFLRAVVASNLTAATTFHLPISLSGELLPLAPDRLRYEVTGTGASLRLQGPTTDVLALALWGRDVTLDADQPAGARPLPP